MFRRHIAIHPIRHFFPSHEAQTIPDEINATWLFAYFPVFNLYAVLDYFAFSAMDIVLDDFYSQRH